MYLVASKITLQGGVSLFLIKVFQMLVVGLFSFTDVMNCEPTSRFLSDSRGHGLSNIQFTIKTDSEACVIISDITSYLVFHEMHGFRKTSTILLITSIFPWKWAWSIIYLKVLTQGCFVPGFVENLPSCSGKELKSTIK